VVQLDNKPCLLGITLQHPPVDLFARTYLGFKITGARGDVAYQYAKKFLDYHKLEHQAEVEIELAIPAFVGLGSELILGLSIAKTLAQLNELASEKTHSAALAKAIDLKPQNALELWGFDQGGLLLVGSDLTEGEIPEIINRQEIQHKEKDAWAFVLYIPRIPEGTPTNLETQHLEKLLQAAPHMSSESCRLVVEDLFSAVKADNLENFVKAMMDLSKLNSDALDSMGVSSPVPKEEQSILDVMRDNGSLTCGRSATGSALYALVKGPNATIALRKAIRDHVGHYGGITMATITDNQGARLVIKD
jgi:predicted sugar kinase